jgi:hypothetical protein
MIVEICEYYKDGIKKYLDVIGGNNAVSDSTEDTDTNNSAENKVNMDQLKVCIFEKDKIKEKELTVRDGFHGVFHEICTTSKVRHLIRNYVVSKAEESETFTRFTKSVPEIFDKSIINTNPWLMYGCRKADGSVYKVTRVLALNDEIKDYGPDILGDQLKKTKMFSIQQKAWSEENASPYNEDYSEEKINTEYEELGFKKIQKFKKS